MRLSTEQLERLSERVTKVLLASGHAALDTPEDGATEARLVEVVMNVLEDDAKTEDRLSREAERLVSQARQLPRASGMADLVNEVKLRLAKAKRITLGDGPERADDLAEKVFRAIWQLDGIDFFSDDRRVRNCIGHAIYRFRMEDEKIVEAVEKLATKRAKEDPYTAAWCAVYDKVLGEVRQKLAAAAQPSRRAEEIPHPAS